MAKDKELTKEFASAAKSNTIPQYGGNILPNSDQTLRTRGSGKGLQLYDELERDTHAFAVLQKRKLAVISREWQVDPASEAPADIQAADMVRRHLANLKFDPVCLDLLDAILKGFAIGEIIWEPKGQEIVPVQVKPRAQHRFVFDREGKPRLLTLQQPAKGIELPENKFIVHSRGAKDGSPYGLGLGSTIFWPIFFKRKGVTFWLAFCDKFGSPTVLGKYPANTGQPEKDKLLEALEAIAQEAAVTVPEGMEIQLLEATRTGSVKTYEALARYMDAQVSTAVLGETLTTNVGDSGSRSLGETHNKVRLEIAKADADMLSETLNDTLIRWDVEINMPGAKPPTVWRNFAERKDLLAQVQRDKTLWDMGLQPKDPTYWKRTYGENWVNRKSPAPQRKIHPSDSVNF